MAIGQKLEEARNRKGISLREASESTKIRGDYLGAFEAGQFDVNLPEVYLRGFIRLYARFLGLDQEATLADLDLELGNTSNRSQKKSLGSLSSSEAPESVDYANVSSPQVTSASVARNSSPSLAKPLLIVGISSVLLLFGLIIYWAFSGDDGGETPVAPGAGSGSVTETNPPEGRPTVAPASQARSLRLSAVGPINRLIVIDEGAEDQGTLEFPNLASGWKKELPFKGSFRLWCSSLENLRFSVDGEPEKGISGEGGGSFAWPPKP
ncbi:MAG TPA: hypothetical protein DCG39_02220 [Opitutae bacterium]|nr:hypothetical protein [Opitutae bacterium]